MRQAKSHPYNGINVYLFEYDGDDPWEWTNDGRQVSIASYMFTPDPVVGTNLASGDYHEDKWPEGGGYYEPPSPANNMGTFGGTMPAGGARWLCVCLAGEVSPRCSPFMFSGNYVLPPGVGAVVCTGIVTRMSDDQQFTECLYIEPGDTGVEVFSLVSDPLAVLILVDWNPQ